jgi:hypothetical protein
MIKGSIQQNLAINPKIENYEMIEYFKEFYNTRNQKKIRELYCTSILYTTKKENVGEKKYREALKFTIEEFIGEVSK